MIRVNNSPFYDNYIKMVYNERSIIMSNLVEVNEKFERCAREVMDSAVKEYCGDSYSFTSLDESTFKALQGLMRLAEVSFELQRETTKTLDSINTKVSELERKLSRLESKVH